MDSKTQRMAYRKERGSYPERMSMISIKHMVLTLPVRGSFSIRARHKGLGSGFGFVLPPTARAGQHNPGVGLRPNLQSGVKQNSEFVQRNNQGTPKMIP
jgi:hypothetical protein